MFITYTSVCVRSPTLVAAPGQAFQRSRRLPLQRHPLLTCSRPVSLPTCLMISASRCPPRVVVVVSRCTRRDCCVRRTEEATNSLSGKPRYGCLPARTGFSRKGDPLSPLFSNDRADGRHGSSGRSNRHLARDGSLGRFWCGWSHRKSIAVVAATTLYWTGRGTGGEGGGNCLHCRPLLSWRRRRRLPLPPLELMTRAQTIFFMICCCSFVAALFFDIDRYLVFTSMAGSTWRQCLPRRCRAWCSPPAAHSCFVATALSA